MTDLSKTRHFTGMSVTLPVQDVKAALQWYVNRLEFKPYFFVDEPPRRGGVRLGRTEVCFRQGPPLKRNDQWVYFDISAPDDKARYCTC